MLGNTIDDKYRIVRMLGEGGMGAVYEAIHTGTGRRVAVKVINNEGLLSESAVARFEREARAAGGIESDQIVQVLDIGKDAGSGLPYLVMELLAGEDVNELLERLGPLAPNVALRIVAQACLGLHKAHGARVVHRDIKPANLFLAQRGEGERVVKLLDFGIAKIKMEQGIAADGSLTNTSALVGSPLFMSPEQARGHKDIDFRTDVWSLGVVLYKLLTGRTPYEHMDALGELILAICSEPAQPVQDFAPWVPEEVAAVVRRALQIHRADRFQSAAEMLDALRPLLAGGFAIHDAMLVPMTDAERAVVAPRLARGAQGDAGFVMAQPRASASPDALPERATAAEFAKDRTAVPSVREVRQAPSTERGRAAVRREQVLPFLAGVAALALASAGVWALARPTPAPSPSATLTSPSAAPPEHAAAVKLEPEQLASFGPLPAVVTSAQNPLTDEKIKLGRMLFYEVRLSKNHDLSCNSCHPLDAYGMDGKRLSSGMAHQMTTRNTPSAYNAAGLFALLWDGQMATVEQQAEVPLKRDNEMAMTEQRIEATLRSIPDYSKAFARAFPGDKAPLSFANVTRAIGAFERGLLTPSRWDKLLAGEPGALTDAEKAGFNDFVQTGCVSCHFGPYVGGTMFQKVGLLKAWPNTMDRGRFEVTQKDVDYMVFRVPSLRNVAVTAPYFHDGSVSSLEEAIAMMARHQLGKEIGPAKVASMVTWLKTLTGELPLDYVRKPDLPPSGPATPKPEPE
jgi:cytochrome c peroxidase